MPRYDSGAERTTIICGCGYRMVGKPDRLDVIARLHNKKCKLPDKGIKPIIPSKLQFDTHTTYGLDGYDISRHGNIIRNNKVVCNNIVNGEYVAPTIVTRTEVMNDEVMFSKIRGLSKDKSVN